MDLTQSVSTLQGLPLGGDRLQLQAPLNQLDLRRLQNGVLARSSSVMDLPQSNSGQFQLSSSAMLVGTVAALQEESGQLRSQWKSDVGRLERELDQLRAAAAYALPHIAEQQKEPNFQALVLGGAGIGGMGSLHQTSHFGLPGAATDRHSPLVQISEREQLLERIKELERQRKQMEVQRDQAVLSQMRCGSAASESSWTGQEAMMAEGSMPTSGNQPHLDTSAQLTEALLCQMRCGAGEAAPPCRSGHGLAEGLSAGLTSLDVLAEQQQRIQDLRNSLSGGASGTAPPATQMADGAQTGMNTAEVYRELERMEMELRKVREENSKLKDQKAACEEAHARDVSTLEAMLSQIMSENQRLTKALNDAEEQLRAQNKLNPMGILDKEGADHSVRSIRSVMEPAIEPDIDRCSDSDRRRFTAMA